MAAEHYTGAIRLPTWCANVGFAALLSFAGLCFNVLGRLMALPVFVSMGSAHRVLWTAQFLSDPLFGVAFFVLLNWGVRMESEGRLAALRSVKALAFIGVFSYSLYLTHYPLVMVLESAIKLGDGLGSVALRYLLCVPVCVGAGYGYFWLVERRFLNTSTAGDTGLTSKPTEALPQSAVLLDL